MKNVSSIERYQTEKAIIDALLKISEIIQKTTNTNQQYSKKISGDGDKKQQRNEYDYHVPIPPPMRTLESYISGFNKKYAIMSSSNCNRAPILLWNSRPYTAGKNRRISNDYQESTHKRHRYDNSSSISSLSNNRKKSSGYYTKESNKRPRVKCHYQTSYDNNASNC